MPRIMYGIHHSCVSSPRLRVGVGPVSDLVTGELYCFSYS